MIQKDLGIYTVYMTVYSCPCPTFGIIRHEGHKKMMRSLDKCLVCQPETGNSYTTSMRNRSLRMRVKFQPQVPTFRVDTRDEFARSMVHSAHECLELSYKIRNK